MSPAARCEVRGETTVFAGYAIASLGTLSKEDDDGSENVAKQMNLRSFKLNRVYLDPFNMSNAGDVSGVEFLRILFRFKKR